jgi:XTP/dITP diphosphohydrolase
MTELLLATNNPGKVEEMRSLLSDMAGLELRTPLDLEISLRVRETGASYAANARIKAKAFAQASGMACLADDSGLEVEALEGGPGLYSARYAPQANPTDADRRRYLLSQLRGRPRPWTARFCSTMCLAAPDGEVVLAEGECRGEIIPEERGDNGFGYAPIFLIEGTQRTMAELSLAEKNRVSHRARAIEKIKHALEQLQS